jgi:uncharacterized OB-fold protein
MKEPTLEAASNPSLLSIPGQWNIAYNYAAGQTATRFFLALRDQQKIYGTHCPSCDRTLVPPRSFCDRCFIATDEWREVGPGGSIVTFTISLRRSPGIDRAPPYMIALIRLDGASTNLIHFVEGCDLRDPEALLARVREGVRVEARFRKPEERSGHILDIQSFVTSD